jgi:hypothetical protein
MQTFRVPEIFEQRLATDRGLRSAVDECISEFVAWFSISKTPFFLTTQTMVLIMPRKLFLLATR